MKTQKLGRTNVEVSSLCLGAMYLGTRNDYPSSFRLLDQYMDAGARQSRSRLHRLQSGL